jgi:hypothetical protein
MVELDLRLTYSGRAHVLNRGDLVTYILQELISIQLSSVVSVLFNAPRRSSSRSWRQFMKDRELLIRSVVNLMFAAWYPNCVRRGMLEASRRRFDGW